MCPDPIKLRQVEAAPNEGLVQQLEAMLEDAREGRLRSVAAAEVYAGGQWGYRVSGDQGEEMTLIATLRVMSAMLEEAVAEAVQVDTEV